MKAFCLDLPAHPLTALRAVPRGAVRTLATCLWFASAGAA
jgi:hypothetical protein